MITLETADNALKSVYLGVIGNQLNVGANPLLTKIWYVLMFLVFIDCILILIKNMKAKAIVSGIILFIQAVLAVGMVYLFESNGTYFDFGMLNQRNDAFGTVEDLSLRWDLLTLLLTI